MKPLRRRELTFRQATEADAAAIAAFCADKPCGAEVFTAVRLDGANVAVGSLWVAADRDGRLLQVIYDNGAYVTRLTARGAVVSRPPRGGVSLFRAPRRRERLRRMVCRRAGAVFPDGAQTVRGTALLDVYKAVRETETLTDRAERRYVQRARAVNAGLAETFAVYEDGRMAATASLCAENERFALIGDVYTRYPYRFQGYAKKLVNACVARAQAQGLTPVLYCDKRMRRFYRRLGFRRLRRRLHLTSYNCGAAASHTSRPTTRNCAASAASKEDF